MALPALLAAAALAAIGIGLAQRRPAAAAPAAAYLPPPSSSDASQWFQSEDGAMYTLADDVPYVDGSGSLLISEPPAPTMLESFADTLVEAAEGAAFFLTGGMFDTAARWIKAARDPKNAAYVAAALAAETRLGIPPSLLVRLIWQESKFNPSARSPAGAVGIMQIIPKWHPGAPVSEPLGAIAYGADYLRAQYDRFGTWELALKAYNMGPAALAEVLIGKRDEPVETRNYSKQILADIGLSTT